MRYFLIADNVDTQTGFRLAGIEGVGVHKAQEVEEALSTAMNTPDIGVILLSEGLVPLCQSRVDDIKLRMHTPLLVEIPDRHGTHRAPDSITQYVRQAIGVKI